MVDYNQVEQQNVLKEQLKESKDGIYVLFTKKDGTEREMLCSLHPDNIPVEPAIEFDGVTVYPSKIHKTPSTTSLSVVDLEAGAWRSFRWDSIIKVYDTKPETGIKRKDIELKADKEKAAKEEKEKQAKEANKKAIEVGTEEVPSMQGTDINKPKKDKK